MKRENFISEDGALRVSIGNGNPEPYYIIYKVKKHLHTPEGKTMETIVEFRDEDIRESKKKAHNYFKDCKDETQFIYSPGSEFSYDPEQGVGLNYTLLVSHKDLMTGKFSVDTVIETTYDTSPNLEAVLKEQSDRLISDFEEAQEEDKLE